jgi:hypothetical protein
MQRMRVEDKVCHEQRKMLHIASLSSQCFPVSFLSRLAVISAEDFTFRPRGRSCTRTLSRSDALGRYQVGIRLG